MITFGDAKEQLQKLLVESIQIARETYKDADQLLRESLMREGSDVYETESLRRGREKMVVINRLLADGLEAVIEGVYDHEPLPEIISLEKIRGKHFQVNYQSTRMGKNQNRVSHQAIVNDHFESWVGSEPLSAEEAVESLGHVIDKYRFTFGQSNMVGQFLTYIGVRIQSEGMFETMSPNDVFKLLREHIRFHIMKGGQPQSDNNVLSQVSRGPRNSIHLFFSIGGGTSVNSRGQFYYALGHLWQKYGRKGGDDCIDYVLKIGERASYRPQSHNRPKEWVTPKAIRNLERAREKGRRRKGRR